MDKQLVRLRVDGLKNHRNFDVRVPKFLAIAGPNGAGKTALLSSVRLGVLGHEPSLGKKLEYTRRLIGPDREEAQVTLEWSDGFALQRSFGESQEIELHPPRTERLLADKQARIEKEVGAFMPSFDLAAWIALSAEERRAYLLRLLPRDAALLNEDSWREWLGWEAADDRIKRWIDRLWTEQVLKAPSLLDGLASALEATNKAFNDAESARREQETVSARATEDAKQASASDDFDPGRALEIQQELQALDERMGELKAAAERAERAATEQRQREHQANVLKMRATDARALCDRLEQQANANHLPDPADLGALRDRATLALRKAKSQQEAVRYNVEQRAAAQAEHANVRARLDMLKDHAECPVCGSDANLDDVRGQLMAQDERLALRVADAQERLDLANEGLRSYTENAVKANKAVADAMAAVDSVGQLKSRLADARTRLADVSEEQARFEALPPIEASAPDSEDIALLEAAIRGKHVAARDEQERTRAAGRADGDRIRADRELRELRTRQDRSLALGTLKGAQQKLRAHVIRQLVEPVETAANDLLMAIDPAKQFKFLFEREDKLTFDFGFVEGGVFRSYDAASTGEDGFLAVVLVTALVQVVRPPWSMLMFDNVECIDDQRRRFLMIALANNAHLFDNVLVAGCCAFADVEGWEILHLGAASAMEVAA